MAHKIGTKKQIFAVLLFFFIIGVGVSLPLIRHFTTAIPYIRFPVPGHEIQRMNMGDHLNLYYNFWLLKDNVLNLRNPFSDPYQFFYWGKKFFNPQIAFFSVLFAMLSFLGDVVAFNLVFLLSFAFAGGATYAWLRRSGLPFWPALVGGALYSLAPHRLSQMCGHINGLFYFAFPLLLYFAEGMAQSPKMRYPVLMGITLFLMAWTEYHMFYYTVLFLVPYGLFLLVRLLGEGEGETTEGNPTLWSLLEGGGIGVCMATVAVQRGWPYGNGYLALIPAFAVGFFFLVGAVARIAAGVLRGETRRFKAALAEGLAPLVLLFLFPVKLWIPLPQFGHLMVALVGCFAAFRLFRIRHQFWRGEVDKERLRIAAARFLPMIPFVVLSAGIVVAIKRFVLGGTIAERGRGIAEVRYFSPHIGDLFKRLNYEGELMVYLGWVALMLVLIGIGTYAVSRWRKRRMGLENHAGFWFGMFFLFTLLSLGFSLPSFPLYALFYKGVPYFKYPRVPGRMIFITYAAMAFCAAWVLGSVGRSRGKLRIGIPLVCLVAIVVDYMPPRPLGLCLLDRGRTVYDAAEKKDMPPKTFLELPIWPGDSAWSTLYQYYVTRYRYPMVNGYSPVVAKDYVDEVFYGLYPMDVGEVSNRSVAMLKKLNVKYVTFHADAYPYKISPFPSWMALKRLRVLPFLKEVRTSGNKILFRIDRAALDQPVDVKALEAIDSPVGVLWEAERSRHLIGKVIPDPDASAGRVLVAFKRGVRGMMMGNQHRFFPAGWYEGVVRIKTWRAGLPHKTATLGALLVMGEHRKRTLVMKVLATKDLIPDAYTDIRFRFHVPFAQKIECIVYSNGTVPLCLDYAYIAFRGRGEGPGLFQAEDLFHLAPVRPLPGGSGFGVRFSPEVLNDRSLWGPLHRLLPGRYQAVFWMATGGKATPSDAVAIVQVALGHQKEVLKARTLRRADWEAGEVLRPFTLTFALKRPAIVQFPVYYLGRGTLWVDRIEVAKSPEP